MVVGKLHTYRDLDSRTGKKMSTANENFFSKFKYIIN